MNKDLPFGKCPKCGLSFTAGHKCIEIIEFNKPEASDDLRAIKESVSDLIEREVERRLSEMIPIDTQKVIDDLHAEVERLRETNRKLAQIVMDLARAIEFVVDTIKNKQPTSADDQVVLAFRLGQTMEMFNGDPLVAAAIAEVKGAKSERL